MTELERARDVICDLDEASEAIDLALHAAEIGERPVAEEVLAATSKELKLLATRMKRLAAKLTQTPAPTSPTAPSVPPG